MSMQTLLCRELSSSYEGEHLLFGLTARYEEYKQNAMNGILE